MPYVKRINSLPLINHISYKYAQVSDIGPSWSSCFFFKWVENTMGKGEIACNEEMGRKHHREKTPWEKEKLLVISYFSFSHSIFKKTCTADT